MFGRLRKKPPMTTVGLSAPGLQQFAALLEKTMERERAFREEFSHGLMREMRAYIDQQLRVLVSQRLPQYYPDDGMVYLHTADGHRCFLDARETFMTLHVMEHGVWEPELQQLMARVLQPGGTFVDIGANIGLHTLHGARLIGQAGMVIAVEAHPRTHALLCRNIDVNGYESRVQAHCLAASDTVGATVQFDYFPEHPGMSGFSIADFRLEKHRGSKEQIDTVTTTIDMLLGGQTADMVKIDVEGFEPLVMRGAHGALRSDTCFVLEVIPELTASVMGDKALAGMLHLFCETGHMPHSIRPDGSLMRLHYEDAERWPSQDIVFLRADSRHAKALGLA